jgi:dimeric dUTPase (all-alpha-NTP-PPase superfamily)
MDSRNKPPEEMESVGIHDWESAKEAVAAFVHERDWEQFHAMKELLIGLNVEAGELLEETLWQKREDFEHAAIHDPEKRNAILDECADILFFLIRILDRMDAEPWSVLQSKIAKNAAKYPVERVKGRSDKYTVYGD